MRIANITCVYPPYKGGIGTAAKEFADLMAEAGHEVITFTPDYGAISAKNENIKRLKTFLRFGNGAFLPQLFWRLKNFDLVFLHYPFFGAQEVLWLAMKIFYPRKKFIIRYHMDAAGEGIIFKIFSWPLKIIFQSFFARADLIISASLDYVRNGDLAEVYKKNPEKFVEIPFGVDTEKFKPLVDKNNFGKIEFKSEQKGLSKNRSFAEAAQDDKKEVDQRDKKIFNILFVGGLDKAHYFKGVNVLLKALALIDKSPLKITAEAGQRGCDSFERTVCPAKSAKGGRSWGRVKDWHLSIVGRGDLKLEYEKLAKDLGIAEKISFLDEIEADELPACYQASDCLVLPSINKCEAFGIVLIEAMACGAPVIASDLPGVRGVFEEGSSGLKAIPNNADDLKEKIKYLMENPEVCKKMGEEARKLAKEKYDEKIIKNKLISLLAR